MEKERIENKRRKRTTTTSSGGIDKVDRLWP